MMPLCRFERRSVKAGIFMSYKRAECRPTLEMAFVMVKMAFSRSVCRPMDPVVVGSIYLSSVKAICCLIDLFAVRSIYRTKKTANSAKSQLITSGRTKLIVGSNGEKKLSGTTKKSAGLGRFELIRILPRQKEPGISCIPPHRCKCLTPRKMPRITLKVSDLFITDL